MALHGVDVSNNNGSASVASAVTGTTNAFVIVKASEGQHTIDAAHAGYTAKARAAHKLVGHYHFGHPTQNAVAEADFFLSQAKAVPGEVLALDLEASEGSVGQRVAYALAWLAHVKAKTGAVPLLYSYTSYLAAMVAAAGTSQRAQLRSYPLWVADPNVAAGHPRTEGWPTWLIHQYGITGNLDQNVLNGDAHAWAAVAIPQPHVTPAPAPKPAPKPVPKPAPVPVAVVHLSHLISARARDLPAATGHKTFPVEVLIIERALHDEGLLELKYVDGSWGTKTDAAYNAFRRKLGYVGADATGNPGIGSLRKLAARHHFNATA